MKAEENAEGAVVVAKEEAVAMVVDVMAETTIAEEAEAVDATAETVVVALETILEEVGRTEAEAADATLEAIGNADRNTL